MPLLFKKKYSPACRRILDFTPEQFAACLESGVMPEIITPEENRRMSQREQFIASRHIVEDVLGGYVRIMKERLAKQ